MIYTKQIDPVSLALFVQQTASGGSLSGNLQPYFNGSGWLGPNPLYTTGGAQTIFGPKTFVTSPNVPYVGTTGQAPSALWVNDQLNSVSGTLTGGLVTIGTSQTITAAKTFVLPVLVGTPTNTGHAVTLGFLTGVSGLLATVGGTSITVTGSGPISPAAFTGLGGTIVQYVNGQIQISGAGQAGGGTVVNVVYQTGDQLISGQKIFTGNPLIAAPTVPSGAVNVFYASGLSGALQTQITGMTGFNVYNTYTITGTGTINLSYAATGSVNNVINNFSGTVNAPALSIGTVTGNFIEGSFFSDPVATGLNLFETFIAHSFIFTGAAFACRSTGVGPTNGGILSGKLYQVDLNNTEQTLYSFTFTSGVIYSGSPGFNTVVTGRNRVGLSIFNSLSGIQKFTVGFFGGNYI